jgi:predicted RND superfamily exporter protein
VRPNPLPVDNLPTYGKHAETIRHCGRAMGGVYHVMVVIRMPEGDTIESKTSEAVHRDLQKLFGETPPLANPLSMVNVYEGVPNIGRDWQESVKYLTSPVKPSVRMFLNLEKRESLATARLPDVGTDAAEEIGRKLDVGLVELQKKYPGYEFELTGMPIVAARALNGSLRKLLICIALGPAAAAIVAAIGLRSIGGGMVVGLAALFAGAVCTAAMAYPGASLNYGNVLAPQLAVGLAVVCAVQTVAAVKQAEPAVPSTLQTVWISTAALVMSLAGCSAMLLDNSIQTREQFGRYAALAIAAVLAAQLLFVPALVRVFIKQPFAEEAEKSDGDAAAEQAKAT